MGREGEAGKSVDAKPGVTGSPGRQQLEVTHQQFCLLPSHDHEKVSTFSVVVRAHKSAPQLPEQSLPGLQWPQDWGFQQKQVFHLGVGVSMPSLFLMITLLFIGF